MSSVTARVVRLSGIDAHPHNVRVDLGDLRPLAGSIAQHGVLTPVVLEVFGARYRIRDGHRRVAAAKIAGRNTVPAIVFSEPLPLREWLIQAASTASHRQNLDRRDQGRAIAALRREGCTWDGIAEALAITPSTCRKLAGQAVDGPDGVDKPRGRPPTVNGKKLLADLQAVLDQPHAEVVDLWSDLQDLVQCYTPPAASDQAHQSTERIAS